MSKSEVKEANLSWGAYDKPIHYQQIEWELGNLIGKILTIVDASISDVVQRKAMKDLIKSSFGDSFYEFQRQASDGKAGHAVKALLS